MAESAGSRSQITSVVAAAVVVIVLLFFTPVLRPMPHAALAGILMAAAISLFDVGELRRMWNFRGIGFAAAMLTMVSIIVLDMMEGIAIGVLSTIVMLVRAVTFPQDGILGKVSSTGEFHDLSCDDQAIPLAGVVMYRFSGPLFFANCSHCRARVEELAQGTTPIKRFIVDAGAILFIDLAGCETMIEIGEELRASQTQLILANVHSDLRRTLDRGGVTKALGEYSIFAPLAGATSETTSVSSR